MNKHKELAKNTIILTVGKICTQFISFLLLPLYTALLSPEEFGVVDLFNTYVLLLVPIFNWQFENGLFRFMLDCREDCKRQKNLFSTVIVSNIIQAGIYLIFYLVTQNLIHSEFKIFLAIDVIINIILNTMLQFPRGLGKNAIYAFGSFLSAATTIIFNVVLIAGLKLGAYGMFLAIVFSKLVTLGYLVFATRAWEYFAIGSFKKQILKDLSKYSVPLIPNSLSWWVIGVSDRTVISYAIGVAANGIYSVANKFSSVYSTFFTIFNLSWTESVSIHLKDEDRDEFLTDTINSMFKLFSSMCFGIISCMPFVFPILINEQYSEAYVQIPILMIAILFQVIMGLFSVIYVALKKSREIAKSTLYAAVINIVINITLINFIGLYAASVSTLIAFALVAIYRYFDVRKYMNVRFTNKLIFSTIIMGGISVLAYYYNHFSTNILALIIAVIYAVHINKQLLVSTWKICQDKLKKREGV